MTCSCAAGAVLHACMCDRLYGLRGMTCMQSERCANSDDFVAGRDDELETQAVIPRAAPRRQQQHTAAAGDQPIITLRLRRNRVTLTLNRSTSGSMSADVLPWSTSVPSLVSIAQVVLLLECGHAHAQGRRCHIITLPIPTARIAAEHRSFTRVRQMAPLYVPHRI